MSRVTSQFCSGISTLADRYILVQKGAKILMLNFLVMIIPHKIIQQFSSRIANDPEDSNHPVDDRAGIVGYHHLIGSRTNCLRDNFSNNKHKEG